VGLPSILFDEKSDCLDCVQRVSMETRMAVERLIPLDAIQAIGLIVFEDGSLDVSLDMGEVIQDVGHALLVQDLDHRDRSISCRKEKVPLQPKRFRSVGVHHAAVGKGDDPLSPVLAGDFIKCIDDAPAKLFGRFAIGYSVPMASFTGNSHDIDLPLLQCLGQDGEVFTMVRQRTNVTQLYLFKSWNEDGGQL